MKRNKYLDEQKEEIIRLYVEEGKKYKDIANLYNVSTSSIAIRLKKWGLNNPDKNRFKRIEITKEALYDMYWNKEMHPREIGDICGCSFSTIHNHMKKYNIPTRTKSESRQGKLNPIYNVGHTEEAKNKMSKAFIDGRKIGFNNCWGKTSKYTTPNQGVVTMRSNWEVKVADYLTKQGLDWLYEPETFKLTDSISYRPDFYIIEKDYYIEVKGRLKKDSLEKINLFMDSGHNLVLWDGCELLKLGIITNSGNTEWNRKYGRNKP